MKAVLNKIGQALLLVPAVVLGLSVVAPVANAACTPGDMSIECGASTAQGKGQPTDLFGDGGIFTTIVNIMLYIIGAVAVIMLIIGGIRYVISGGKQEDVTAAKNTILYAVIGIIVSLLAFAIVNFVIKGVATT